MKSSLLLFCLVLVKCSSGSAYFQQQVDYDIRVTLNDKKHELHGFESITYLNNSSDTLHEIFMHLWPNAYQDNHTALAKQLLESGNTSLYYANARERGFIDSLNFKVDEQAINWKFNVQNKDICLLTLNNPILPGSTVHITTSFRVKIPSSKFSRLGYSENSYQLTQWYPKPAVYDHNGWNAMPYLHQGEFYSEFGTFNVYITIPKNYVVAATGELQSEEELDWLSQKAETTSEIAQFPSNLDFPQSDSIFKTIHYRQEMVHDFAWFADKRFHVLKDTIQLNDTENIVTSWLFFTNYEATLWQNAMEYVKDAVKFYSKAVGQYPYSQVSAVEASISAGGGMEYPTITVIGEAKNAAALEHVIVHEVGHNWFYGILGSNERIHPWMDEGINSYYEERYFKNKYGQSLPVYSGDFQKIGYKDLDDYALLEFFYQNLARENLDQPIELSSADYSDLNYGEIVYAKTAFAFQYLESFLSTPTFDHIMQEYYGKWKFKHPYPGDIQSVFDEVSGMNLSWFFDTLLNTNRQIDYGLRGIHRLEQHADTISYSLNVCNVGELPLPFSITRIDGKDVDETTWFNGHNGCKKLNFKGSLNTAMFIIDKDRNIPEVNRKNNTIRTNGLLKRIEPLQFQFAGFYERRGKTNMNILPVVNFNYYDKFMLGAAFYNMMPTKRFEFLVAPMYGFGSAKITGFLRSNLNMTPTSNLFRKIQLSYALRRFSYSNYSEILTYLKHSPQVSVKFKQRSARSSVRHRLIGRSLFINTDANNFEPGPKIINNQFIVHDLTYIISNQRAINPMHIRLSNEFSRHYIKHSFSVSYYISSKVNNKGIQLRFFMGKFSHTDASTPEVGFAMSGNRDYLFDELLMGRSQNNGILNQQFTINDGGFKNISGIPESYNWLSSLNVHIPLPGRNPLSLYADFGLSSENNANLAYDAGINITIIPNFIDIYVPALISGNLNALKYYEKIRYTIRLNILPEIIPNLLN